MTSTVVRPRIEWALLDAAAPEPLPWPRSVESVAAELRRMHHDGELDLPEPSGGATADRWRRLAGWGRRDLTLARLAEGHCDALAILHEAGRAADPTALYGVWASRSGSGGPTARERDGGWEIEGRIRFCSGAGHIDRAIVAVNAESVDGPLLVDVSLRHEGIRPDPHSWPAFGMDASESLDVHFDGVPVAREAVVGWPGFYTARPGFALGGAGVAAVWLGGAAGILDDVFAGNGRMDEHRLAHLGAVYTAITAADALLERTATACDRRPGSAHRLATETCRAAVEHAAGEVLARVPTITGPGPLCWDRRFAQRIADLQVYVGQHHGEADLAALASDVLAQAERADG